MSVVSASVSAPVSSVPGLVPGTSVDPPAIFTGPAIAPAPASVAPTATLTALDPVADPLMFSACSTPALTVVTPVYVLAPLSTRRPGPALVSAPRPTTPENVV